MNAYFVAHPQMVLGIHATTSVMYGGGRIFMYLTARSFDGYVFQAIEAKARGFKAVLRRSLTVRVVEDVDEVVLSAAEAKALVAGDPDVLKRVQLQTDIHKFEALRAAHLDQQVQARWELKRLPQRIADLRTRVEAIAADVAFRDAEPTHTNTTGENPLASATMGVSSSIVLRRRRYFPPRSFAAPKLRWPPARRPALTPQRRSPPIADSK